MPAITVNGIVTRYANYRESDRILTLFTREIGTLSAAARGCRAPKNPVFACSELFVCGEFVLYEKNGKYTVTSCSIQDQFYPIREDMDRFAAGMHALSMTDACVAGGQQCEELYKLLSYTLSFLSYTERHPLDLALCFSIKCLDILGYAPTITRCATCGRDLRQDAKIGFSPEAGGAVCVNCIHGDLVVSPLALEAMRRMMQLPQEDMRKVILPLKVREELKPAVRAYAERVLEHSFKALTQIAVSNP